MRRATTDHRGRGAAPAEGEDESCAENGVAGRGPDPE